MSNRQFKSQASSSRAALGSGGFGGFGSASSPGSTLSYLTPPPDLKHISDPNVVVAFKGLSKKDATTKTKALEDLCEFVQPPPVFQEGIESAILEAWVQFYPKLGIDNSRRVRELAHQIQYDLTAAVKKRMEQYMPGVAPTWLAGTLDRDRVVSKAAKDGLTSILDTDDKVQKFWKTLQPQILEYARSALDETPQSLCDDRSMSKDEMQETYLRVVGSSASLVEHLLSQLNKSDFLKHQNKYALYFNNNPGKLWGLISSEDAFVRKLVAQLLIVCLKKQHGVVEANLELISKIFIAEALSSSQTASAFQLIQALEALTAAYPEVWTSFYKSKKSALSRLQNFVAKGSRGGPAAYWQSLQSLLTNLPDGVLPTEINASIEFLSALRDGINSRDEQRSNAEHAWAAYFHIADLLVKDLSDKTSHGKLFQEAVFPIFEHYFHPSVENPKWMLGDNSPALARAFVICASSKDIALHTSWNLEWQRLADGFIHRLRVSLAEKSNDYGIVQALIQVKGHRWFKLLNEVYRLMVDLKVDNILEQHSTRIITAAFSAITTLNGQASSAAELVDTALRLTPRLFRITENMSSLETLCKQNFNRLLISPSMDHLVSILHGYRDIHERYFSAEKPEFAEFWQSAVCSVLQLSEGKEKQKLAAIKALIASRDIIEIGALNQDLQVFLYKMCVKALHGDEKAWPVFETAVTFHVISPTQANLVVQQIISGLVSVNEYLEDALRALELLAKNNEDLLKDRTNHIMLLSKLVALDEKAQKGDDISLAENVMTVRVLVEPYLGNPEKTEASGNMVAQIVRGELGVVSPQSLLVGTLFKEAQNAMKSVETPEAIAQFFPGLLPWGEALAPFLQKAPSLALGVLRPFAGAVFLVSDHKKTSPSAFPRDARGYSVALRMALFSTHLFCLHDFARLVPQDQQAQYLYYLALTYELVNDQIDLLEENMLFESTFDPDSMQELRRMLDIISDTFSTVATNASSWRQEADALPADDTSRTVRQLVGKFLEVSGSLDPQGYYAGKALARFLEILWAKRDWNSTGGDYWLEHLGIMNSTTQNVFGASAVLIGFGTNLRTHKPINLLCNRLISDIAVASPSKETLQKLVLLNSCLAVYQEQTEIPVAHIRLISAVKQILSWRAALLTTHIYLASEAFRALHLLLPSIKVVYGPYWEDALLLSTAIWSLEGFVDLSDEIIPVVGMSLKLVLILQGLTDANDDLSDALVQSTTTSAISNGLVNLLKLRRSKDSLPLQFVDDLLLRQVGKMDTATILDLDDLYPLIASEFRPVQSAAFDILRRVLIHAQELKSLDAALEGTSAILEEELLSLLLDAPTISAYEDADLELFPLSVRGYLLSWHLVFDSFSSASNKVRGDYSTMIGTGDYVGPFLSFMFDILGHSAASPLKLDRKGINDSMIRNYDMWVATNSESLEHDMHWLLANLYFLSLKYIPGLVKNWWLTCKDRQTSIAVTSWTEKYFSALIVQDLLDDVSQWSEKQEAESDDGKSLSVKVSRNSREVFAGYEVDDMEMKIVIHLPPTYPLKIATVESIHRVAIPEQKWQSFLRSTQGAIQFTNGSIVDGLETFRKNVAGALKGHVECAICYSIVSSEKRLPDRKCATCNNLFHNDCLHKWFNTSNSSTCPLCRCPFQYGTAANRPRQGA